jgi:polysaccharide export outer membrane protein
MPSLPAQTAAPVVGPIPRATATDAALNAESERVSRLSWPSDGFDLSLVKPTPAPAQSTDGDYILSPSDVVEMTVFREPDLTTKATISRDGTIQLPLVNDVRVGGLTVRQARDLIRKLYDADYLVEPQISLGVTQYADRKFTIIGQVNNPGAYPIKAGERLNLLEAIGMAGGFTRIADRGRVVVKRGSKSGQHIMKVNTKQSATAAAEPLEIRPGDIITVGESWY